VKTKAQIIYGSSFKYISSSIRASSTESYQGNHVPNQASFSTVHAVTQYHTDTAVAETKQQPFSRRPRPFKPELPRRKSCFLFIEQIVNISKNRNF